LPASDGWDNDGIAPRDFLAGLVETYRPGHYFTYPPLHLVLLGLLTLPVTAVALLRSASLAQEDVIAEILKVPYMTAMAYAARIVAVAMSLGIVYALAKIAETLRGPRAGHLTAAFVGFDMALTYYAHTSNLDVPYLFWSSLSLLALVRAMVEDEPRRLRAFAVCMVAAMATKDQSYALFALAVPIALAAWLVFEPQARRAWKVVLSSLARAALLATSLFLVFDAVVLNPSGFRARIQFLTGPASQDFAQFSGDVTGRIRTVKHAVDHYLSVTPTLLIGFVALGLLLHGLRLGKDKPGRVVAGFIPLLAAVSFTLTFNCVARRVEHRFVMPQMLLLAVYGGIGMDWLLAVRVAALRALAQAAVAVGLGQEAFVALAVDNVLINDPRYGAERWARDHIHDGDTIETYGLNVYLPRFPSGARVARVGPEPPTRRNPMLGFEEVQDRFDDIEHRKPKFIVLPQAWAWRYLDDPLGMWDGIITPPTQMHTRTDPDGTSFFRSLMQGRRGYKLVHTSEFEAGAFPRIDIHGCTARPIWIFERE
jgi:hypothetical protein